MPQGATGFVLGSHLIPLTDLDRGNADGSGPGPARRLGDLLRATEPRGPFHSTIANILVAPASRWDTTWYLSLRPRYTLRPDFLWIAAVPVGLLAYLTFTKLTLGQLSRAV